MAAVEPGKIRNVAVVGHRGTGKTSLVEAMLFQGGQVNRLGTIDAASTVSDWDDEEHRRSMSLSASPLPRRVAGAQAEPRRRPRRPGLPGRRALGAARGRGRGLRPQRGDGRRGRDRRGCGGAPTTSGSRASASSTCSTASAPTSSARSRRCRASSRSAASPCTCRSAPSTSSPGSSTSSTCARTRARTARARRASRRRSRRTWPTRSQGVPREAPRRGGAGRRGADGALPRGPGAPVEDVAHALKDAVTRGEVFPVGCAVATKNLGTTALLDLLVEGVPSPKKKGAPINLDEPDAAAFVFKTIADPFAGRITMFRVLKGSFRSDSTIVNERTHEKERLGPLLVMQGKDHTNETEVGEGDIAAVAKLKDTLTGDLLVDAEYNVPPPEIGFPEPVMSFAVEPRARGRGGEARDLAPAPVGGGPDPRHPPRPADGRAAALGDEPDARRGRGRPPEEPLRRRRRAAPAACPVPRDDPQGVAGAPPLQEADGRPRPVRRLRDRARADRRSHQGTSSSTRSSAA